MSEVSESRGPFLTHANYIKAFCVLTGVRHHGKLDTAYRDCAKRILGSQCLPNSSRKDVDSVQVRKSLANAWGTELLMRLSKTHMSEDELVRLSNTWTAVQTYYVVYHATQALAVAKGHPRPQSHSATQKMFADFWAKRALVLPPWSLAVGNDGAINIPPDIAIENLHSWTDCSGDNAWSLACKALRTTWDDEVADSLSRTRQEKKRQLRAAWTRQEERRLDADKKPRRMPAFPLPRLTVEERQRARDRARCSTLIDYLYRLRIRTNYEDSAMFTDGPEGEQESLNVGHDLRMIAGTTLLLHELAVLRYVGKRLFLEWNDEWTKRNVPAEASSGLSERRAAIESVVA